MNEYHQVSRSQRYQEEPQNQDEGEDRHEEEYYQNQDSVAQGEMVQPGNGAEGNVRAETRNPPSGVQFSDSSVRRDRYQELPQIPEETSQTDTFIKSITPFAQMLTDSLENSQRGHEKHYYLFHGTPNTIGVKTWFGRIESRFKSHWTDERKIGEVLKNIDTKNIILATFNQQDFQDYDLLKSQMITTFGDVRHAFDLSIWDQAKRFKGTKFGMWLNSPMGMNLTHQTAIIWNSTTLSDAEISFVMKRLAMMVPKCALQQFYNPDLSFKFDKLRSMSFSELINHIKSHEQFNETVWATFANSKLPTANDYNVKAYQVNSVEATKQPQNNRGNPSRGNFNRGRGRGYDNPRPQESQDSSAGYPQGRGLGARPKFRGNYNHNGSRDQSFPKKEWNQQKSWSQTNYNPPEQKKTEFQGWKKNDQGRGGQNQTNYQLNQQNRNQQFQQPAPSVNRQSSNRNDSFRNTNSNPRGRRGGFRQWRGGRGSNQRVNYVEDESFQPPRAQEPSQPRQFESNYRDSQNAQRGRQRGITEAYEQQKNWTAPPTQDTENVGVLRMSRGGRL